MASGNHLVTLYPRGSLPPTTVYASHGEMLDSSTVVGVSDTLRFAGAVADESADWIWEVPPQYSGGGVDYQIWYAMDGTDGSDVQNEVRTIKDVAADVLTSQNLGAQTAVDITDTPGGSADAVDISPIGSHSHANADSPAVGDQMRTRVTRDFDHAANADVQQILKIRITET